MTTENVIEMERKYLISENVYNKLISNNVLFEKEIKQNYLFTHNTASIFYKNGNWTVSVFAKTKTQNINYVIRFKQLDNLKKSNEILSPFDGKNLIKEKGFVFRFRLSNDQVIFTCKYKNQNGVGDFEFEVELIDMNKRNVLDFMSKDYFNVYKNRKGITGKNDLVYELDKFTSNPEQNLFVAEVEFPSEDAYNAFVPDFDFEREVTKEREFKNNFMSLNNGLNHLKTVNLI